MAGQKTNTVTYVFEGDTLSLEESINRVKKLLRSSTASLKKSQNGELTETQKVTRKQTKELLKTLEEKAARGSRLTDEEAKQARAAGRQALANVKKLNNEALRLKDTAKKKEWKAQEKANSKAQADEEAALFKHEQDLQEATSPAGQLKADTQATQLERLSKYAQTPEQKSDITSSIEQYRNAEKEFAAGKINQDQLGEATLQLNEKYKQYAATLRQVNALQNQNSKGSKKNKGLANQFTSKFKSLGLYKLVKSLITKIFAQVTQAFKQIASISEPFNASMTEITSSFKYIVNSLATILVPLLKIVAPILKFIGEIINKVSEKLAKFFAMISGENTWVKATKQVEDYADAVNKATNQGGIDELNKLDNSTNPFEEMDIDDTVDTVVNVVEVLDQVLNMINEILDIVFELIDVVLADVVKMLGPILTFITDILKALVPVITSILTIVTNIVSKIIDALGPALTSILELIVAVVELLANIILALLPVIEPVLNIVADIIDFIASALGDIIDVVTFLVKVITSILTPVLQVVAGIIGFILLLVSSVVKALVAVGKTLIAIVTFHWSSIPNIWSDFTANIKTDWQNWGSTMGNSVNNSTTYLASGGVVTGPTLAMVGEGANSEAVVPLGQSPQFASMKESIAETVVQSLGSNRGQGSSSNQPIVLNLDGRTLAKALWPSLEKTYYQVGVNLK